MTKKFIFFLYNYFSFNNTSNTSFLQYNYKGMTETECKNIQKVSKTCSDSE